MTKRKSTETNTQVMLANSEQESPQSLIKQAHTARWLNGEFPFFRAQTISPSKKNVVLTLPAGHVVLREGGNNHTSLLQEADDHSWLLATLHRRPAVSFFVAAKTEKLAIQLVRQLAGPALKNVRAVKDPNIIPVRFWHLEDTYPDSTWRKIGILPWEEIIRNYVSPLEEPVTRLMKLNPDEVHGKIILVHGPPGTGKTTLLRALGGSWRSWCDVHYILDPDKMLMSGTYMTEVLLAQQQENDRWRLIIMEDTGELFKKDAKETTHQAFARLLNMSDGMLGQGQKIIFALTTNESFSDLHDAVLRPGRALANLPVPKMNAAEAKRWMEGPVKFPVDADSLSLAELLALREPDKMDVITVAAKDMPQVGQYL